MIYDRFEKLNSLNYILKNKFISYFYFLFNNYSYS